MLIDTHCHLDAAEFAADRDEVVTEACQAGVVMVVVPAVARATFAAVAAVCRDHPGCAPAYGIHPMYTEQAREEDLDGLREMLAVHRETVVAVGEIGLDYFVPGFDQKTQEFYLVEQLKLARELDLPVILHVRRAVDAVLKQLRRHVVRGGIAHAFNGSPQQAREFIRLGFKLGFGGAMTYPRASRIREMAAGLPLESIVLETDAPDIPPEWLARHRNEPRELPRIAAEFARLRGVPLVEVAEATGENALRVLPGLQKRLANAGPHSKLGRFVT